ncbi:MAG: phytase [bacterium]
MRTRLLVAGIFSSLFVVLGALSGTAEAQTVPVVRLAPAVTTEPVANDPDDPAIWRNAAAPEKSRIIGTNKVSATEGGALYVFDLQGKICQVVRGLDRPNNVDVKQGVVWGNETIDIAAVTERNAKMVRVYRIAPETGFLTELGRFPVFVSENGEDAAPMGIALYKRATDSALFAFVGRKSGPATGYLWQYRLTRNVSGGLDATKVRAFGDYSGKKEIEAIAVDEAAGRVYYADERFGIHVWNADPDAPDAAKEIATFAKTDFQGDHEGIAVLPTGAKDGFIVSTDQIPGDSRYRLFSRQDYQEIAVLKGGADETDGIEICAEPLGSRFPNGVLVVMNSGPRNFLIYDLRDVLKAPKK